MTRPILGALACALLLVAAGCKPAANKPADETPAQAAAPAVATTPAVITDIDWNMTGLGERTHPLGAGGKQVTLRFDAATQRAGGFGGCNRYNASYSLRGDSLSFGPGMSTKMACPDGMELEEAWLKALPRVVTFAATETNPRRWVEGPCTQCDAPPSYRQLLGRVTAVDLTATSTFHVKP